MKDIFEDMFEQMNALFNYSNDRRLNNNGLKYAIKRPHNLYTIKDKDGKIIQYKLDVVTTPFKKDDVNVSVQNNILSVTCGKDNYHDENEEYMVYRGISSQAYEFKLKLDHIDINKISAKIEDGILHIIMPILEDKQPELFNIEIK